MLIYTFTLMGIGFAGGLSLGKLWFLVLPLL